MGFVSARNLVVPDHEIPLPGGGFLRGFGFCAAEELSARLAALPADTRILLMHQMGKQFVKFPSPTALDLDAIPPFVEVAFIGDIHVTEEYVTPAGTRVISPGSTRLVSLGEAYQKYMFDVNISAGRIDIDRVRIPTRIIKQGSVLTEEDLPQIDSMFENMAGEESYGSGLQPVAVIEVNSDVKDAGLRIREFAAARGIYVIMTSGSLDLSLGLSLDNQSSSDEDILARFIPQGEPAFAASVRLLKGEPIRETLRSMKPKVEEANVATQNS